MDYPRDKHADTRRAPKQEGKPYKRPMPGLPSSSGVSRHRRRISEKQSVEFWENCLRRFIRDHLEEFPEFQEDSRLAGIDGIAVKSVHTAEIRDPDTGEVTNPKSVTKDFEGGSAISRHLPRSKYGHGFLVTVLACVARLALGVPITQPMPGDEKAAGLDLIEHELMNTVKPYVTWTEPGVLVCDGNFFTHKNIRASYRAGYIPQIHPVAHPRGGLKVLGLNPDGTAIASEPDVDLAQETAKHEDPVGADAKSSKRALGLKLAATRRNYVDHVTAKWPIVGHDGWYANRLREATCCWRAAGSATLAGVSPGFDLSGYSPCPSGHHSPDGHRCRWGWWAC